MTSTDYVVLLAVHAQLASVKLAGRLSRLGSFEWEIFWIMKKFIFYDVKPIGIIMFIVRFQYGDKSQTSYQQHSTVSHSQKTADKGKLSLVSTSIKIVLGEQNV